MQGVTTIEQIDRYRKEHRGRQRIACILLILALLVSAGVFWQLRLTGLSQTGDAYCGHEEHRHSEACVEQVLACSVEEGAGHVHSAEAGCFAEGPVLVCEIPEQEGEHVHSVEAGCFATEPVLVCTQEESAGHVHGEGCYEAAYGCGFDEHYDHVHTLQCYSNPEADVETPEMWQASVSQVSLSGNWAADVAAVAGTQLGYRESKSNYQVQPDGVSYKGYTRYGAWRGEAYGEWDAAFASFCLHFAGVPAGAVCQSADVAAWPAALAGQGAFASAAEHDGQQGDLVFFDEDGNGAADGVGIVTAATDTSLTVVAGGNKERAVVTRHHAANETTILGYAPLSVLSAPEQPPAAQPRILLAAAAGTDMSTYVSQHGGAILIEVLDKNNIPISGTEVYENEDYHLAFSVNLPLAGFLPGSYYYQLPSGVNITELAAGADIKDSSGTTFGNWTVDAENGRVLFEFHPNANGMQNVQITISFGVRFEQTETPIEFEGNVSVVVRPEEGHTPPEANLFKYGYVDIDKDGTPIIRWGVNVQGSADYPLKGMAITDTFLGEGFNYADIDLWVEFFSPAGDYHYCVYVPDWLLSNTPDSWTYTIPSSFECEECNDPNYETVHNQEQTHPVYIGDDWGCDIYFDTPHDGRDTYENKVVGGGKTHTAIVMPGTGAGIVKNGRMEDGVFKWTTNVTIPGGLAYQWYIWDYARVKNENGGTLSEPGGTFSNLHVKAKYNNEWIDVPNCSDATANHPFAYRMYEYNPPEYEHPGGEIYFYNQCTCESSADCSRWEDDACSPSSSRQGADNTTFCRCWDQVDNVQFEITYEIEDRTGAEIISQYGGNGNYVRNTADLNYTPFPGTGRGVYVGGSEKDVPVPGVFTKKLLASASGDNNYTAEFSITVNEELRDLSEMSSSGGVTIVDTMSSTLFYEQGSMVVTTTDPNGIVDRLTKDEDYTIEVSSDRHVININIPEPGQYLYRLEYNAALNVSGQYGALLYDNSAVVELMGRKYTAIVNQQSLTNYSSTADNFQVTINKTREGDSTERLANAQFGLYNQNDGLVASGYTNENGVLVFETNIAQGIVFHTNAPYYLQEITAPAGYVRDDTKHWFYFAKDQNIALEAQYEHQGGIDRFPYAQSMYVGTANITNTPYSPVLPDTGGFGVLPFAIGGLLLVAAPLLYGCVFRREQSERRS